MAEFYKHQHSQADNIQLAHTVVGEPVTGQTSEAQAAMIGNPDVKSAVGWSTRPYKPDPMRKRNPNRLKLCASEGCGAFPTKVTRYCINHSKALGLMDLVDGKYVLSEGFDGDTD